MDTTAKPTVECSICGCSAERLVTLEGIRLCATCRSYARHEPKRQTLRRLFRIQPRLARDGGIVFEHEY